MINVKTDNGNSFWKRTWSMNDQLMTMMNIAGLSLCLIVRVEISISPLCSVYCISIQWNNACMFEASA